MKDERRTYSFKEKSDLDNIGQIFNDILVKRKIIEEYNISRKCRIFIINDMTKLEIRIPEESDSYFNDITRDMGIGSSEPIIYYTDMGLAYSDGNVIYGLKICNERDGWIELFEIINPNRQSDFCEFELIITKVDDIYDSITVYECKDSITVTDCKPDVTELYIPKAMNGKPVTRIASEAFAGNESIEYVVLPDTVKFIGEEAFYDCEELKYIHFGNGVLKIEQAAFQCCTSLTELILPNSLLYISMSAFECCDSIKHIEFGPLLFMIEEYAFCGCNSLRGEMLIPKNVRYIGSHAFKNSSLETVSISGLNYVYVESDAFPENTKRLYY